MFYLIDIYDFCSNNKHWEVRIIFSFLSYDKKETIMVHSVVAK